MWDPGHGKDAVNDAHRMSEQEHRGHRLSGLSSDPLDETVGDFAGMGA